jgi:hypothetical protein
MKFIYTGMVQDRPNPDHTKSDGVKVSPEDPALSCVQEGMDPKPLEAPLMLSIPTPRPISLGPGMQVLPEHGPPECRLHEPRFAADEDATIMMGRLEDPPESLPVIAKCLQGRVGKHCGKRWTPHLSRKSNSKRWTPGEDDLLGETINKMAVDGTRARPSLEGRRRALRGRRYDAPDPHRKECDEREACLKEVGLSIVDEELIPEARTLRVNATPESVCEPLASAENETKSLWDRTTTDDSSDERFLISPGEQQ